MASCLFPANHTHSQHKPDSESQVQVYDVELRGLPFTMPPPKPEAGDPDQFTDPQRAGRLAAVVRDCWASGLYSDVTIIVKGQKFPANRVVLAAMSDYFRPLFEMDERNSEVTIHCIEPQIFKQFLEFAYTGKLKLTCQSVQSMLIASDYLSVTFVKSACEMFMSQNLDVDNVCDVWAFTQIMPLPTLHTAVYDFLCHHLDEVQVNGDFASVNADEVAEFLRRDELVLYQSGMILRGTSREKIVFEAVLTYLSNQDGYVDDVTFWKLMFCVRLPMLPKEDMNKVLKAFKALKADPRIKEFMGLQKVVDEFMLAMPENVSLPYPEKIPQSWFNTRKLAATRIYTGPGIYAAGGHVAPVHGPPTPPHNDLDRELAAIDVYIRRWDGRPVVGCLAMTYRSSKGKSCKTYGKYQPEWPHYRIELGFNETIQKVTLGSGFLIDRLGFETNTGRMIGPFGGSGGSQHEECAPPHCQLLDFACDVAHTQNFPAIHNLQMRWLILL